MPQLSPMYWIWLYFITLMILGLILIKLNFSFKNSKKSKKPPFHHPAIPQRKWKN
uniref:ATP synthase F0 subunit 8 n=1 Tax=Vespula acadica TaxID=765337 RepID=A0A0U2DY62_9HYME|nr:ATP synthase F0 subunit 8 [Vespula acadica]